MFYEDEIRREDEYRADTSQIVDKELGLAVQLIEALRAPFEPAKYKDSYREKLQQLIESKVSGSETYEAPVREPAPVVNILNALEKSLGMAIRKPPVAEAPSKTPKKRRTKS
jgi:DNA end-binding protein Ku